MGATVIDTDDLLSEVDEPFESQKLRRRFVASIDHEWCARDPYSLAAHDRLLFGWNQFAEHVRHVGRFLFLTTPRPAHPHRDEISVADMLDELALAIVNVGHAVLRQLPSGSAVLRGRAHEPGGGFRTAAELGSPPPMSARANRMSPAGISMFYACEDTTTVAAELYSPGHLTVSTWTTTRDVTYLDLADLPEVPSIFDMVGRPSRAWLRFLHDFSRDLSKPAHAPNPEVTYVPTQVFTEFVRRSLRTADAKAVDAIRYRSSRNPGGICWVLFAGQDDCIDHASDAVGLLMFESASELSS